MTIGDPFDARTQTTAPGGAAAGETASLAGARERHLRRHARSFAAHAILIALSLPIIFYGLGDYSLVSGDEGFYHHGAREMARSGDWFTLRFLGEIQLYETFLNAPIHYWMKAVLICLFGDSYWTMRITAAVFALLTVLMTYRLTAYLATPTAAFLASLAQLTTFQFVYWHSARTGELEPIVTFVIVLAAYLFLRALEWDRSFLPHHLCLVLLVNLKLPLVVLPVIAEGAFFLAHRETRRRFREWIRTGLLVLPLAFLWHGYQAVRHAPEMAGIVEKLLANAAGDTNRKENRAGVAVQNLRFYATWIWRGAFPYVLAYLAAFVAVLSRRASGEARGLSERARWGFIALLLLAILAFYVTIVTKHIWYIIPCYPFLSAMTGAWLDRLRRERHGIPTVLVIAAVLTGVVWIGLPAAGSNPFSGTVRETSEIPTSWRTLFGVAAPIGVTATFIAVTTAQLAGRAIAPMRTAQFSASLLAGLLIAVAAMGAVAPLRFVHHKSEMERVRELVMEARAKGQPVSYPIRLTEPGILKAQYFFGDDFDVRPRFALHDSIQFELHPKALESGSPPQDGRAPTSAP